MAGLAPMVVSGPSGSGKSTLLNRLFADFPNAFAFSVSHTTRNPRAGEVHGKSYHFVSRQEFESMIAEKKFIEHAEFSGNLYGTSIAEINSVKASGKVCVLDLEVKGVQSIKTLNMGANFVFIQPPSLEELEKRLRNRNTESEDSLARRLQSAKESLDYAAVPGAYDVVVINNDMETAYNELKAYIMKAYPSMQDSAANASGATSGKPTEVPKSKACNLV